MVRFNIFIYNNKKMDYEEINNTYNIEEQKKFIKSRSPGDNSNDNSPIWKLMLLRNTRNNYLSLTDKYVLPDYPISLEKKELIIEYRKYLRDFINNNNEKIMNGEDIEIDPIPLI